MNIAFYTWNKPRKTQLMKTMADGARALGHKCQLRGNFVDVEKEADVAVFTGCNQVVKAAVDAYAQAGKHYVYVDKGYLRYAEQGLQEPKEFYRVAVDCFQPSNYVMELGKFDQSRWDELRIIPKPHCVGGRFVIYADVSEKYRAWFNLGQSQDNLRDLGPVIYRSRNDEKSIYEQLENAWLLVTPGSNASVDAILYGVPVVVTGESCISLPITSTTIPDYDGEIYFPSDETRYQWLCGLAWCQFTLEELSTKFAWHHLTRRLES